MEFRCEKCGKLLNVDSEPGSMVRCPHCNKKIVVPAALASMPHPQMPANTVVSEMPANQPVGGSAPPGEGEEEVGEEEGETVLVGAMAKIMPYVISLFLHVGVALILAFMSMVVSVAASTMPEDIIVPDAVLNTDGTPGGLPNPGYGNPNLPSMQNRTPVQNATGWAHQESSIMGVGINPSGAPGAGGGGKAISGLNVIGMGGGGGGGGGGPLAPYGLGRGGSGMAPKSSFFGTGGGGNVYHVCYVIDRSGSMIDTFDAVRQEMLVSISRMRPVQDFHIILFAEGSPKELEHKRLVPATDRYKEDAAKFLEPVRAEGKTDPVPALNRAFDVLASADITKRQGKLIYLLTDGVFPDNAKVLDAVRKRNGGDKKTVLINTYLYGNRPPEAEKVLQAIAAENGGRYKYVSSDE